MTQDLQGVASKAPAHQSVTSQSELDIFVARGFLGGADYERYVLKDSVLWRECGAVTTGKSKTEPAIAGDEILTRDPNLDLQERRVEVLTQEQLQPLRASLQALSESLATEYPPLPKPGSVQALSGPGVFELSLNLAGSERRVLTSVDSVANGENTRLRALRNLFGAVRDQGPIICKSRSFFGM